MSTERIVAALQEPPLCTVEETCRALDAHREAHGLYAWWLADREALPDVPTTLHPSEPGAGLLYVGIGPNGASSLRKLRQRFRDHTQGNTGNSTFRLVLAAFLFDCEGWRPYWTDRALLTSEDNRALSEWQTKNLRCQWVEVPEPWEVEADVIAEMRPPLNRGHNRSHPFYAGVGRARGRYRDAARANPV